MSFNTNSNKTKNKELKHDFTDQSEKASVWYTLQALPVLARQEQKSTSTINKTKQNPQKKKKTKNRTWRYMRQHTIQVREKKDRGLIMPITAHVPEQSVSSKIKRRKGVCMSVHIMLGKFSGAAHANIRALILQSLWFLTVAYVSVSEPPLHCSTLSGQSYNSTITNVSTLSSKCANTVKVLLKMRWENKSKVLGCLYT